MVIFLSPKTLGHSPKVRLKACMNEIGWPYHGTARQVLSPLYHIALDYKKYPIRVKGQSEDGYTLRHMRRRIYEIFEKLDKIIDDIVRERQNISD